jgi:hypothetical protein
MRGRRQIGHRFPWSKNASERSVDRSGGPFSGADCLLLFTCSSTHLQRGTV